MAITDLTGYTWIGNSTLDIDAIVPSMQVVVKNINFTSNNMEFTQFILDGQDSSTYFIGKSGSSNYRIGLGYGNATVGLNEIAQQHNAVWTDWYDDWDNDAFKTIQITGGTDVTNATLISWLEANGTLTKAQETIELDLSTLNLPEGTHSIQLQLSDDGLTKRDSELSEAVSYTKSS